MTTYLMLGKYSDAAVGEISAERTENAAAIVGDCGGKIKAGYALLGEKDILLIAEFPGTEEAMKASVALSKLLGISFATSPAVSVEEFDKLITGG